MTIDKIDLYELVRAFYGEDVIINDISINDEQIVEIDWEIEEKE
jgi:hypothetical protein